MKKTLPKEQSKPSKASSAKDKKPSMKKLKSEGDEGNANKRIKMVKQQKELKKSNKDEGEDDRFDAMTMDPRFRSSASSDKAGGKKIVVDERFSSMFTDEEFKSSRATVDKYGRKISKSERTKGISDLTRHYTLSEQEQERLEKLNRIARGEADGDDISSSDSSDEDDLDEEEEEEEASQEILLPADLSEESSPRLAIIGCDWAHIRALDLFAVLKSFIPPTGAVLEVAVYSSEFGRKRMAAEEVDGPFANEESKSNDEKDEEEEEDLINEMGNEYDPEKLRKYEKERLLYYFAVVTCDSAETAEVLYRECDGIEFEHSAIGLDLRFIPNDVKFDPATLRDRAEDVPDNYAPLDFINKSMQQTRVQLTWDEPEHDRRKLMDWSEDGKKKKDQGIPLDELEAFIASEDDADESEDEEERRVEGVQKYRQLLAQMPFSKTNSKSDEVVGAEEDEINGDDNNPSEDEFFQDVEDVKAKLLGNDDGVEGEGEEDVEKQKKFKKPSKHSKLFTKEDQLAKVQKADDDEEDEGPKKKKADKRKKKKKQEEEEEEPQIDVEDERFSSLFTEPEFAFDRTDPKFKKTNTIKKIEEERRKRMSKKD